MNGIIIQHYRASVPASPHAMWPLPLHLLYRRWIWLALGSAAGSISAANDRKARDGGGFEHVGVQIPATGRCSLEASERPKRGGRDSHLGRALGRGNLQANGDRSGRPRGRGPRGAAGAGARYQHDALGERVLRTVAPRRIPDAQTNDRQSPGNLRAFRWSTRCHFLRQGAVQTSSHSNEVAAVHHPRPHSRSLASHRSRLRASPLSAVVRETTH